MQSCSHAVAEIVNINSVSGTSLYTGSAIRIFAYICLLVKYFLPFKKNLTWILDTEELAPVKDFNIKAPVLQCDWQQSTEGQGITAILLHC